MDVSILEDLGLTRAEIKLYISLLELGASSAGGIIERSRLQNSVVHRGLNSLIEKGLISFILEGKRKIYRAASPENFHEFIEQKRERFDQILPELKARQQTGRATPYGEIFKGKRGIDQLYRTLLGVRGEYNTFGGGSAVTYDVMGETWWKNLHTRRIARRIPCRQVFDETIREFGEELNKRKLTKIKFLPEEYAQLQETIIIGDHVGIAIFTQDPYGVLIRDKAVADGYRKQFEILWKKARS